MAGITGSPLAGRRLVFLGSSVTYGSAADDISFADYIAARNDCTIIKEAVSGTTLVENGAGFLYRTVKKAGYRNAGGLVYMSVVYQ